MNRLKNTLKSEKKYKKFSNKNQNYHFVNRNWPRFQY